MTEDLEHHVTERLRMLDVHDTHKWPSVHELQGRARRRAARRRAAIVASAALVVAAGVVVPLRVLNGNGNGVVSQAHVHLRVVDRSGDAVELAASTRPTKAQVGGPLESQLAGAEEQFSLTLLDQVGRQSQGANVVVSPSSLAIALSMLELGARGPTADQIARALGTSNMTSLGQAQAWQALSSDEAQASAQDGIDLSSANSMWMQQGVSFVPSFMSALSQYFDSGVWRVDFAGNPDAATAALNGWVSAETRGRITQLFAPGDLDSSTLAVLVNAVYFKAAWENPFDPNLTSNSTFVLGSGATEQVPFMETDDPVNVPATFAKDFDAAELPYKGGRFAALVILPKTQSLSDFVDDLTPASLGQIVTGLSTTPLKLSMPKVQLKDDHDLNSTLEAMGVRDVFQNADLSGMSAAAGLAVQQVRQSTFLKVAEEGTEAAAATGGAVATSAVGPSDSMTIDRPYLFVVRDTKTGAILFSAAVENPAQ